MFMPDFFLPGAPKSGTTSLSEYLRMHSRICMSQPKEPHFFQSDFSGRRVKNWSEYEGCFRGRNANHLVTGEASAGYLVSEEAVPRIMELSPTAKFVVLLRNPVDLVYSLHSERVSNASEPISDFQKAWEAESKRKSGKKVPRGCKDAKRLFYSRYGLLGEQVDRLLRYVPRDQVFFVKFEHFIDNTAGVFRDVQEYLGVPVEEPTSYEVFNANKKVSSIRGLRFIKLLGELKKEMGITSEWGVGQRVKKYLFEKSSKRPPLDAEFKNEVQEFFREDIELLERGTGLSFEDWRP